MKKSRNNGDEHTKVGWAHSASYTHYWNVSAGLNNEQTNPETGQFFAWGELNECVSNIHSPLGYGDGEFVRCRVKYLMSIDSCKYLFILLNYQYAKPAGNLETPCHNFRIRMSRSSTPSTITTVSLCLKKVIAWDLSCLWRLFHFMLLDLLEMCL